MADFSPDNASRVTVRTADEADRRRVVAMWESLGFDRHGIVVKIGDAGDVDYVLPPGSGDDVVRTAVELLAKIATLRGQLAESHRTTDELVEQAATDPLTGLPNRRAWDEALNRVPDKPMCIALFDLDQFKQVNDVHGHTIGDAVLRAAADGLRHAIRRGDLAARLGGDEFGLLLPDLSPDQAPAVVERIRQSVNAAIAKADLPATTCSAGHAPDLAPADAALRRAKQSGRNQTAGPA